MVCLIVVAHLCMVQWKICDVGCRLNPDDFNVNNNDDGAAMRAAPFGIFAAGNPDQAAYLAGLDAEVSHYADGIWAAQAVAAAISVAMVGAPVDCDFKGSAVPYPGR